MKNAYNNFHNNNSGKTAIICFFQWVKFNTDVTPLRLFCGYLPVGRTLGSGCYLPGPGERGGWGREQDVSRNSLPHQIVVSSRMQCERTRTWLPPHTLPPLLLTVYHRQAAITGAPGELCAEYQTTVHSYFLPICRKG